MNSQALKELWSIPGKHKGMRNILYGVPENPLIPYNDGENPKSCVFAVRGRKGKEVGYLFDNILKDEIQLRYIITDKIGDNALRMDNARQYLLGEIFAGYHNMTVKATKQANARTIRNDPCWWFDGVPVYDFRKENLVSDTVLSSEFSNASILRSDRDIMISCGDSLFWTEYNPDFYLALHCVRGWKLNRGRSEDRKKGEAALVATLVATNKRTDVAFAEIVWQFHKGIIDTSRFAESVIENHDRLIESGLVIDHLTHRRTNNYSWALAAIPDALNHAMSGRDKIAPPFYFHTVYDKFIGKFRVHLGAFGMGWERRYLFDDINYRNPDDDIFASSYPVPKGRTGYTLYAALFDKFSQTIGKKYLDSDRVSYLRFWSDPERVRDKRNMLVSVLDKPLDTYTNAIDGIGEDWNDLARIADLGSTFIIEPSSEED